MARNRSGITFLKGLFNFFDKSTNEYTAQQQQVITGTVTEAQALTSTAVDTLSQELLKDIAAENLQVSKEQTAVVDNIEVLPDGTVMKFDGKRYVKFEPNKAYVDEAGNIVGLDGLPLKTVKAGGVSYNPAAKTLIINT